MNKFAAIFAAFANLIFVTPVQATQVGDVVYLKSGSMAMTVIAKDGPNWVVQWARGSDLTTSNVPDIALTATDPRPAIVKAERDRKEAVDPTPKPEAAVQP